DFRLSRVPTTVEEAMNATVTIKHKEGHGSGCLMTKDGYVITNFHVVAGMDNFQVLLQDGKSFSAKLVRKNEAADLALLKIDANLDFAYLVPSSKNYSIGQEVFAIGTPTSLDLGQTVSKGIISGIRKVEKSDMIQTDVSVNPGNSGGALINAKGELVGIVNSKIMGLGVEGIAFCIPAWEIARLLSVNY
ncbi:MAG: trypsin-like peptidase domain-containing protein, partial [Ferruginibacter sp.]|nr:trypsin-like peptidase domain-containing protein [Cytophagales bacterium]